MSAADELPLPAGDPDGLTTLAAQLDRAAAAIHTEATTVGTQRTSLGRHWKGDAAAAADRALGGVHTLTGAHPAALRAGAKALRQYAGELDAAQTEITKLQADWTATEGSATSATAADHDIATRGTLRRRHAVLISQVTTSGKTAAAELAKAESTLPDLQTVQTLAEQASPPYAGPEPTIPPAGTDPRQVAKWWAGMTPAQRVWLKQHRYHQLRDVRGLPAVDANEINRRRLADDLDSIDTRIQAAQSTRGRDRMLLVVLMKLRENILSIRSAVERHPDALLLTYDPIGPTGAGRAAIALGNPDTANNTAIVVPGTGHDTRNLTGPMRDGSNLRLQMSTLEPEGKQAVIVWAGYDAPDNLFPQAAHSKYARAGRKWLTDDVTGYQAAHEAATGSSGHTTVIGHSYGSVVTGMALSNGLHADDAVFVGSPGVGVDHAVDLGMDPEHVYVGRAFNDPIVIAGDQFGQSPDEGSFGATRFGTAGITGHSDYYEPRGGSLRNIGLIAVGQGDQVTPYATSRTVTPVGPTPR